MEKAHERQGSVKTPEELFEEDLRWSC